MYIFTEVSMTGELPKDATKRSVLAGALNDWGCCMAGATLPNNFGKGMVRVGQFLNVAATPESLMEYSEKLK